MKSKAIVSKQQSIRNKKPPTRAIFLVHILGSAVIRVDLLNFVLP